MAKPTGFMEYDRQEVAHRPIRVRVKDYRELDVPHPDSVLHQQAARCMDCGIPFCHSLGCPVLNRIPEFNDLVYKDKWREASDNLHSTNNFPEITGRICPAPCESACTLNIGQRPVTIKHVEYQVAERAFAEGWIQPMIAARQTGRRVAVIGSGPAGLAAAQQLARRGHDVTVLEKDDRIGGLLRYGIPDFKLEKHIIDRRLKQLSAEGVKFETGVHAGRDVSARYLNKMFDAICLTIGAGQPRSLGVPGAAFKNVVYAMDYLTQQNRRNAGDFDPALYSDSDTVTAQGKVVVVLGGGDTGSDCIGTAIRQGAREVHQFEIMPRPPENSNPRTPWPTWPQILRTSSSQEEGCHRRWSVLTNKLMGQGDLATELRGCEVEWIAGPRGPEMKEVPSTAFSMKVDLVLLAMGFVHPVHVGLVEELGLKLDERGNLEMNNYMTSEKGIFTAGDAGRGALLVVRAIYDGRQAATAIDQWLGTL